MNAPRTDGGSPAELPLLEDALRAAAARRRARRRRRPLVALAVMAAVAAVPLLRNGEAERAAAPATPEWTTTTIDGDAVSLPPGWQLAPESLTPHLVDPKERFSAATFPVRYVEGRCSHLPDGAVGSMRSTDALVSVQERRLDDAGQAPAPTFAPRPPSFEQAAADRSEIGGCLGDDAIETRWIPFADAGRNFYALVVLGRDVAPATRAQAFAILDRLRFHPVRDE